MDSILINKKNLRTVFDKNIIERVFLQLVAEFSNNKVLIEKTEDNIKYDDMDNPEQRYVLYGTKKYGLAMKARPLFSGYGVHGEDAEYIFYGLPTTLKIIGYSYHDHRKESGNSCSLDVETDNAVLKDTIYKRFKELFEKLLQDKISSA